MLENYSLAAQHVVSMATAEARQLGHPRVGTEHLLLGLLADVDGEPAAVLRAAGASLAAARHTVVEVVGADAGSPDSEPLPLTPRAQRALDRAARFSRHDREPEVNAVHVLLGVLDVEGLACQVLRGLGVDVVNLRAAVVGPRADDAVALVDDQPSIEVVRPRCPQCQASLDGALAETLITTRREKGEPATSVSVVYCRACGATLGVLRPESSSVRPDIGSQPI